MVRTKQTAKKSINTQEVKLASKRAALSFKGKKTPKTIVRVYKRGKYKSFTTFSYIYFLKVHWHLKK